MQVVFREQLKGSVTRMEIFKLPLQAVNFNISVTKSLRLVHHFSWSLGSPPGTKILGKCTVSVSYWCVTNNPKTLAAYSSNHLFLFTSLWVSSRELVDLGRPWLGSFSHPSSRVAWACFKRWCPGSNRIRGNTSVLCKASTCIVTANISQIKASHMAKSKCKRWVNRLHLFSAENCKVTGQRKR